MIRGVRGATTVLADKMEEVLQVTEALAKEMMVANDLQPDAIASVIVSTTPDVTSIFPAKAIRSMDEWKFVPVMCTHEMDVPSGLPKCIRSLMHVNTTKS